MRFVTYLREEFVITGVTSVTWGRSFRGTKFPIFRNPSTKEMRETVGKNGFLRFMVDWAEKDLYIWTADVIHQDAAENLIRSGEITFDGDVYATLEGENRFACGTAKLSGGKLEFYDSDYGESYAGVEWLTKDDKWLNRWFNKPFIKIFRRDYEI